MNKLFFCIKSVFHATKVIKVTTMYSPPAPSLLRKGGVISLNDNQFPLFAEQRGGKEGGEFM
jgi:hypothetical protein